MAQASVQKPSHVFVNCPFDGQYKGLFISDIGGQDVKAHGNDKKTCIRVLRDWLNDASGRKTLPGGNAIHEHYLAFEQDLPKLCRKLKIEKEELTYNDFAEIASSWLEAMNS